MNTRAVVPDFELPATGNQRFLLSSFRGHPLVLCFCPKHEVFGVAKTKSMYGRRVLGYVLGAFGGQDASGAEP